jgi:phosphonate transport system ATP-binding protein
MVLFEFEGAHAAYNGERVLHGISLRIEQGERVALVGRSGAGKSTLLNLLYRQQRRDAALVPQDLGLVRSLSVFHNVYMGQLHAHATLYNLMNLVRPMRGAMSGVRPVVERLGLADKLFAPVGELSGGQQQRTAVGRALYQGSAMFLGDEPVSAVDEHQARAVLESIVSAHETTIIAMHDQALAVEYCERIIGLEGGRVVMDEPAAGMTASDFDHLYQR